VVYVVPELEPYFAGDTPQKILIESLETIDGDRALLTNVMGATAEIGGVALEAFVRQYEGEIELVFPSGPTLFPTEGLYSLILHLTTAPGMTVRVEPATITVQGIDGWHTLNSIREGWRDAPDSHHELHTLLMVARRQVLDFAPAIPDESQPPVHYRLAQGMQARNLYISTRADPSGNVGDDGFTIRPFPMDWVVKGILRPKRGRPVAA